MSKRVEEKAIDSWAIYEYREHPKGLYHTCFVDGYKEGYEQAEKDIISIIESRLSELLGDAQPTPILRYELMDLVKKIKED
jgi:hypothetical protein